MERVAGWVAHFNKINNSGRQVRLKVKKPKNWEKKKDITTGYTYLHRTYVRRASSKISSIYISTT